MGDFFDVGRCNNEDPTGIIDSVVSVSGSEVLVMVGDSGGVVTSLAFDTVVVVGRSGFGVVADVCNKKKRLSKSCY